MSVVIRGMKMPNCYNCTLESICLRWAKHDVEWQKQNRDENCPIVELPAQHGRLIDADALIARIRRAKELQPELSDLYENEALEMLLWVGTEPTVIESENPFFESLKTGLEQAINGDVREQTIIEAEEVSE